MIKTKRLMQATPMLLMGLAFLLVTVGHPDTPAASSAISINGHTAVTDGSGKLLSWAGPQDQAYDRVMRKAWDFLISGAPIESNGLPAYYGYSYLSSSTLDGADWPHNPASTFATMTESALTYYAYSGDSRVIQLVRNALDFYIAHGLTPVNWVWAGVPYASSDPGATTYRGANDINYGAGRGDGIGVIEPDKVGEFGYAFLNL
jgi:hypothetical protein